MKTKLAVSLIVLGMLIGALLAVPPARAIAQVVLDPPKFHPLYYVPGEQLQFTVTIAAGDPTLYDILVTWDDGVTRTNWSGNQFNDVTIAGSSVVLAFNIPAPTAFPTTPDGDWYWIEVHDSQWIERNGTGPGRQTFDTARFSIRTWTLTLETGRAQYLPGDLVTITWSANMIRDGSLAPAGYGQLWVYDWPTNNALITPNPYILPGSTGQFQFRLNNLIPTNRLIVATAWYNDTQSNPDRFAFDSATAAIDGLRMITNVVAGSYEPGGIVTVDISAKNTDFPPLPPSPGAADVNVKRRRGRTRQRRSTASVMKLFGRATQSAVRSTS